MPKVTCDSLAARVLGPFDHIAWGYPFTKEYPIPTYQEASACWYPSQSSHGACHNSVVFLYPNFNSTCYKRSGTKPNQPNEQNPRLWEHSRSLKCKVFFSSFHSFVISVKLLRIDCVMRNIGRPFCSVGLCGSKNLTNLDFIFLFILKFIYLILAALGLCCCARAFSSCGERGLLFVAARGLLIAVASLARALGAWASVVVARGLSSCCTQALECRLSSCGTQA